MTGLSLIDALFSKTSVTSLDPLQPVILERIGASVEQMAEVLVKEHLILDGIDRSVEPDPEQISFGRTFAELLHGEYEKWCHEAEALLKRIARVEHRGRRIETAGVLRDCYGRTMAILQVTPDKFDESEAQARAEQGYTLEEVRNEVRALVRAERAQRSGEPAPDSSGRSAGRDRVAG